MTSPTQPNAFSAAEIVSGDAGGGANTSHTILVAPLAALLEAVPPGAPAADYEQAVLAENVLGKQTHGARRRTFRYLRELYLLSPESLLFRALRDLWPDDAEARPLLAGLCALARDPVYRASSTAVFPTPVGEPVTSTDLTAAVVERFPGRYGEGTAAKIGRNTASSWTQTGHLVEVSRTAKARGRAQCRPSTVAYALMLGHLEGVRGDALFETLWARALDRPVSQLIELAVAASQQGLIEFRHAGGVVEVGFRHLVRPSEGVLT